MTELEGMLSMYGRRAREIGLWVAYVAVSTTVNATSVLIEFARISRPIAVWEPFVWEYSSGAVTLLLIPCVLWLEKRKPFTARNWRIPALIHAVATIPFSIAHVTGMVAIRKAVYLFNGRTYDFGAAPIEFLYEWRKDALTYGFIIFVVNAYRVFRERADGDANFAAETPLGAEQPTTFRVTKGGRDMNLPVSAVEWIEAAGNYVVLHAGREQYMMRSTLKALEARLGQGAFLRVHRSALVNAHGAVFEMSNESAHVRLPSGETVRVSKRLQPAVRRALGPATGNAV